MLAILGVLLIGLLVLGGGSARADVPQVVPLRILATLTLIAAVFVRDRAGGSRLRTFWMLAIATTAVIAASLVPLPPAIWTMLPGRAIAVDAGAVAGLPLPWRPLTLVPDRTLNALVAMMPPLAILAVVTFLDRRRSDTVFFLVAGAIAASAFLGALQTVAMSGSALRLYAVTNQDASVGLFANRNHHAVFLACGIPVTIWLVRRHIVRFRTPVMPLAVASAIILFLVALILANGSRSGLVAALFALILTGGLLLRDGIAYRKAIAVSAAVLMGGLIAILLFGQNLRTLDRLSVSGGEMRYSALKDYWSMIVGYFPVGSGYGTFSDVYRIIEPEALLRPTYLNAAHNDLAQIAIEGGAPALILLGCFLAWWGTATWRLWAARSGRTGAAGLEAGRVASIITAILLLASLFDYPLRTPLLASLFLAACALMALSVDGTVDPPRASPRGE